MLPEDNVGGGAILTVVQEDSPVAKILSASYIYIYILNIPISDGKCTYIPSGLKDSPTKNS